MKLIAVPEVNDVCLVSFPDGRQVWSQIKNVDEDGAIYCVKRDGLDFMTDRHTWDPGDGCWRVKSSEVTI